MIYSNSSRPCDAIGSFVDDRRNLGILIVLIENISILNSGKINPITTYLTTEELIGWHPIIENAYYRWTKGNAHDPVEISKKEEIRFLIITILSGDPYIIFDQEFCFNSMVC